MPQSNYGATQVRNKTNEVVDYHYDDSRPGKPLHLLIPGGFIALASLALIIYIGYSVLAENLDQTMGITLALVLVPFYVGGVFLFSYGYELYNVPRAIRLTAIIVFITIAAVVIIAVLFLVLGGGGKGKSSSSSSKSSSSSSDSHSKISSSSSSSSSSGPSIPYIDINPIILGTGGTHTVTREVVHEVPVIKTPQSITCPYCGRAYVPAENKYACPNCGGATTDELRKQSEA